MRRGLIVVAFVVGSILTALPAFADVSYDEVEAARQELNAVSRQLEGQVAAYERAVIDENSLRDRLDAMVVAVASRERELVLARRAARDRAAEMYMTAGSQSQAALASDADLASAPARYVYLDSVSDTDREVVNRLETARRDFESQQALLDDALTTQEQLRTEMNVLLEEIYGELETANSRYQAIKSEWDQQERDRIARELFLSTSTTTTTPPSTAAGGGGSNTTQAPGTTQPPTTVPPPPAPPAGTMVCPVDGATTFRDSWGEPRSGGRGHKGVDMMAATGTPLVAIETGYIYRISSHYQGGLGIYVHGESGSLWYYAHNSAIAEGVTEGTPVVAGQRIAYVGYSGNASADYPHLHFAWMPNADWVYQNPYPIVDRLCR
jgi:murein DD-endopeptidase MepM/ murein hydrolase activator NlpD